MYAAVARFLDRYSLKPASADYADLCRIARAFAHLPYENVTKILKAARSASAQASMRLVPEVIEDHLRWNTGGTCFSLCNALQAILTDSGFPSFIAMADMHYGENIHCAVIAESQGDRYILDPGYLIPIPVPVPAAGETVTRQTIMNTLVYEDERDGRLSLYTVEEGVRKWRYRLKAWPVSNEEFGAHWIRSFSLNTIEEVMMSRLSESGRLYFRKSRLEEVSGNGRKKQVVAPGESARLAGIFGVPGDLILQARSALLSRPGRAR